MSRSKKSVQELNFIDIFSGAGGLSCGMEAAGMRCLLGADIDSNALKTFAHNHKEAKTFCGHIEKLDLKKIKKLTDNRPIHAVVGGPPCQGFSTVGRGNPNDLRNKLFLHFVRIVKITKPYFLVVENVTGLLAKKNEKTLRAILSQFEQLGYTLNVQVMSAHHYGVPEKRRRTIILGSRINTEVNFPHPLCDVQKNGKYIPAVLVGDVLDDLADENGNIHNHDLNSSQVANQLDKKRLSHIPEGKGIRYQEDEEAYLPKKLRLKIDWKNIPEGRFRQTKFHRLHRNEVGPTIMTHRHNYYHPIQNRHLTAREAAKIQSFPNNFLFLGPNSSQWRQIGNAVPPLLGKAVGSKLKELYKEAKIANKDKDKTTKRKSKKIIEIERSEAFNYKKNKKITISSDLQEDLQ